MLVNIASDHLIVIVTLFAILTLFYIRFAKLAAVAMVRLGIPVHLFSDITPTPFLAYAVRKYKTAAGIMVTASHNPKEDNGYKVFWSNGAQIIPPHDRNIAHHILENLEIQPDAWNVDMLGTSKLRSDPYDDIYSNYYKDVENYAVDDKNSLKSSKLKFTYTPMHGVGQKFMEKSFEVFGLNPFVSVLEQSKPDPNFPTVAFPNPEEGKSALDLAMKAADANNSSVIIANDPDADRLACAERSPSGSWYVFNGNELGAIMGTIAYENFKSTHPNFPNEKLYMVASTVSSKFLRSMSQKEGFLFEDCLTGFKWMANYALRKMEEGYTCLFGYEESIGYMYGTNVMDKDGISAGSVLAAYTSKLYDRESSLSQYLQSLYTKYGYHISNDSYYLCFDPPTIVTMFRALRDKGYPTHCGEYKIVGIRDVTTGYDSSFEDKKSILPTDPSGQMLTFTFDNGCVGTLRASGTEPKIKYYTEIISLPGSEQSKEVLAEQLLDLKNTLIETFLQPGKYGLTPKAG